MPETVNTETYIENAETVNVNSSPQPPPLQKIDDVNIQNLFDSLKKRYQSRYDKKLDKYFEITLKVSKDWSNQSPEIIKVKYNKEANTGEAIKIVDKSFQEKGRLLIIGNPGVGKTVLLLKLAISLLEKCDFSKKDWSIPVIFNLATWSSTYKDFENWLVTKLVEENGLSKGFAENLLKEEKIILLLDGLDELARNKDENTASKIRADCMKSLNGFLKLKRKTVICCRREEFIHMQETTNQDAPVSAKVEVLDLTEADIKSALKAAEKENYASARHILKIIENNKTFLEILKTPFYFTLASKILDSQIEDEEYISTFTSDKDYKDEIYLKYHLIEDFVRVSFKEEKGHRLRGKEDLRFSLINKSNKSDWLTYLARLMEKRQLITFEIADLQSYDLQQLFIPWWLNNNLVFCILSGLIGILVSIFLLSLDYIYNYNGFQFPRYLTFSFLLSGLISGGILGLVISLLSKGFKQGDIALTNWDLLRYARYPRKYPWWTRNLSMDIEQSGNGSCLLLVIWLVSCSVTPIYYSSFNKLKLILLFTQLICILYFVTELIKYFSRKSKAINQKFEPIKTSYKRFKKSTIRTIFGVFIATLLSLWTFNDYHYYKEIIIYQDSIIVVFYFWSIILTLLIITTPLFKHFVLRLCLFLGRKLPLRLATFLNDAAEVGVLEKDGGFWRFRHQNIQEYTAGSLGGRGSGKNWQFSRWE